MIESYNKAHEKLQALVQIYTPSHAGRAGAVSALTAGIVEFEQAVREDERMQIAVVSGVLLRQDEPERGDAPAPVLPVVDGASLMQAHEVSLVPPERADSEHTRIVTPHPLSDEANEASRANLGEPVVPAPAGAPTPSTSTAHRKRR